MAAKRKIPTPNSVFNRLTFLEFIRMEAPRQDGTTSAIGRFRCRCGTIREYAITHVTTGLIKGCGCLRRLKSGEAAKHRVFRVYKNHAKARSLGFHLTLNEFSHITSLCCHYCGRPPQNRAPSTGNTGDFVYNGIDRVDNSKGYFSDNCVPCCSWCNHAKATGDASEFIEMCQRVAEWAAK